VKSGIDQMMSAKATEITKKFGMDDIIKRTQAKAALDTAIAQKDFPAIQKEYQNYKGTFSNFNEMKADSAAMDVIKRMDIAT
jgi:hypothetical protein